MVSIIGILDSLTPNCPSSWLSSSRRGRMNDRPFRVIGKRFQDLFRSLADPRVGAQWNIAKPVCARSIWPRLAKERSARASIQPRLRP